MFKTLIPLASLSVMLISNGVPPRGVDEIEALKSDVWNSPDTDWVQWAVVHVCPTRIYQAPWTDTERFDYIQDFDPDVVGFWGGISMNRGDYMRMRGIAAILTSEYEYQESIAAMNGFGESLFASNGPAIKEDGTAALRWPWNVPYMTVIAPKWRETIQQGISRQSEYGDGVFQDNIAATIDGVGGGSFSVWENHFFQEYLTKNFTTSQRTYMGVPTNINDLDIRQYVVGKRQGMNNEALIREPLIHEFIRFNNMEHLKIWVSMADRAKKTAVKSGKPVPVMAGHLAGAWGRRVFGLPITAYDDVVRTEVSSLLQVPFSSVTNKQAESSFLLKASRAAGQFERPVWLSEYPDSEYSLRVSTAVALSEAQSNGAVPVQSTYQIASEISPSWGAHKKHAQFASQNRHLFTDRSSRAKIALVQSLPSLIWRDFSSMEVNQPHFDSLNVAARLLEDHHLLYDALLLGHPDFYDDAKSLARLSQYDMLILPDVDCISDVQATQISNFITAGGSLVLWGGVGTCDEEMFLRTEPIFDALIANPGNGEVIVVSSTLANDYRDNNVTAENTLLSLIQPHTEALLETTLPQSVWVNLWESGAGPMQAIHMVNYDVDTTNDTVSAVNNFTLSVKPPTNTTYTHAMYFTPGHFSAGSTNPAPISLSLSQSNGYVQVSVPNLDVYGIVVFSVADELTARNSASQARKYYERLKLAERSQGQNAYSNLLADTETLLSQIQGDAVNVPFAALTPQLDNKAVQLESSLSNFTANVEAAQWAENGQTVSVNALGKYDFGGANVSPGWISVSSNTLYLPVPGYGWTDLTFYEVRDAGEPDGLHRDFIRSQDPVEYAPTTYEEGNNQFPYGNPDTHPAKFRVDVPNGDYVITVIGGDYSELGMNNGMAGEGRVGNTYVDCNGQSVLYGTRLKSGQFLNRPFEVSVINGYLELTFQGENVGPMFHNSIEWLVNGIIIQTPGQVLAPGAQDYLDRATLLSDAAVRDWNVVGPFADDTFQGMDMAYGPEESADIMNTYVGENGSLSWRRQPFLTGTVPFVDFGSQNPAVAYAKTMVYSPSSMSATLAYNTSEMGVGWLNGIEIFRDDLFTGLLLEEGSVAVNLQAGWNTLLIKSLHHWDSEWGMHVSLLDAGANIPLTDISGVIISAEEPPETTISYWQMDDETSRDIFRDAVWNFDLVKHAGGSSSALVAVNPVPNPDLNNFSEGTAAENTNSYQTVRANTAGPVSGGVFDMKGTSSWTFEGWFNWSGNSGSVMLAGTRGVESGWNGWELVVEPTASDRLNLRMDGNTYVNTGANSLARNAWTHVALVWDHTTRTASIFLNGVLAGSGTGATSPTDQAFYVGGRDGVSDGLYEPTQLGFSGKIDELRFFGGALTPMQFLNN